MSYRHTLGIMFLPCEKNTFLGPYNLGSHQGWTIKLYAATGAGKIKYPGCDGIVRSCFKSVL